MTKNKVYVRINGSEYTMTGDDPEDYLFLISRYLDKKIKETLSINPKHSNTSAAVLSALMITDELFKMRRENAELKNIIKEPEFKLSQLEQEYETLKNNYAKVSNEYEELKLSVDGEKEDVSALQSAYNQLYESYVKQNEEYDNLLNESLKLQEQNSKLETELTGLNEKMITMKDELLENEIESVKVNKELKDIKEAYSRRNNI
jgi:cell division protein ZapA